MIKLALKNHKFVNAIFVKGCVLNITPFIFAFSLWNGVCGVTSRGLLDGPSDMTGQPLDYYRNYIRTVCDLLEWQPTSDIRDYDPYLKEIMSQVFQKELKKVGGF
ncbi:MAG: hypothetical protein COB34_06100 [Methylophilaceae bacterium]|nr:MAG: hypothetical protein COB34_06100 [Methylophilaceae bacterium]